MPNIPTHIVRLFGDSDTPAQRANREIDAIRTRYANQARRGSSHARNKRH
jgi:hypothetical protein